MTVPKLPPMPPEPVLYHCCWIDNPNGNGIVQVLEPMIPAAGHAALRSYTEDCLARLRVAVGLIEQHNQSCRMICGEGDQEGVRCKYRPYFPRHCPECPLDDIIDLATIGPLPTERSKDTI